MAADPGHIHPAERKEPLIPRIRVTREERNRLILVGIALVVLWWILDKSMSALSPFIIALVIAYLMYPLIELFHRYMPRAVAVLLVYGIFLVLFIGILAWLVPLVGNQIAQLSEDLPKYTRQAQEWGAGVMAWYNSLPLPPDLRTSLETSVRNAVGSLGAGLQQAVSGVFTLVSRTMGLAIGLVIIPFWLFYVLVDTDRAIGTFNNMIPRGWRSDVWRIIRIINGVFSSYIRGQLLLGVAVGLATTIGMLIVGAPYAIILGIISGITEIIPVVGPILGAIPGLILAAFSGDWVLVLKVLAVYVVVQQLENNLLVPKIQGDSVKLHPAIILVALVVGSQVAGLFGLIVAVPVTAILRDVYLYLYRRFGEDYTPREAEASVPTRQDEFSAEERAHEAQQLEQERAQPGINSATEMLAEIEKAGDEPQDGRGPQQKATAPPDRTATPGGSS